DLDECGLKNRNLGHIEIDISEYGDTSQPFNDFLEKMPEIIPSLIAETADGILSHLKLDTPRMLEEHKNIRSSFESHVAAKWGNALNLLETLIVVSKEAGSEFSNDLRSEASASNDFVFEALVRLHARACQVASEILTLLRAGYADGAHARWRTLHEINVVVSFISKFGTEIAERYLLHNHIESRKAALQYQDNYMRFGLLPIPEEKLIKIEEKYQSLIDRYGHDYRTDYGWAGSAFGNSRPSFADIERNVDFEHMRPYYRLASHNIHANPKGIIFRLGLPNESNLLLSGASEGGLVEPGHGTIISLYQLSTRILTIKPNIDRLVTCIVMGKLADEAGSAFMAAHSK
ncbi:MAG: hypothetical protein JWQ02_637, partial [Capsulimonas sp.]|nr:hypothetical protein [Capsulimonas sp.]